MCGVAGLLYADASAPIERDQLVAMAAIQRHRGPDGFGLKVLDGRGVGFSHARLSIIDLDEDRARQPFVSPDRRLMVAHNGEFYDYQRLRADLTSRGARFRTKSDTELLLHLYPRYGLDGMLRHLRGEFAFALYDDASERLALVRDRFGIKPLYWTLAGDDLVFGSEIKVLLSHPRVERELDPEGLFHQLMQVKVPGKTAFRGVHAVEPGCAVIAQRRNGRLEIKQVRYWDIDFPAAGSRPARSDDYYIEGVRAHLLEAVEHRLEADVPVACYLSGGIDSTAILGLSAACRQDPVKAFTIGFDDAAYDEAAIARRTAVAFGADQDVLRVRGRQLYEHFEDTVWHAETSIYNTFSVAKLLMSRHVHEAGYKVVVTGEGSDELFAGYPQLRRDLILHGMQGAPESERAWLQAQLESSNELFRGNLIAEQDLRDPALESVVGFTPSSLQPWLACAGIARDLLHPRYREQLEGYEPGAAIAEALDADMLAGRHALDKAQYVWIKTQFERQVLGWAGDRVDMANSMEARPAFLDHHLVEFATELPPHMRVRGTTDKYVLREAMVGLLPTELYEREKFAFMAPPSHSDSIDERALETLAGRLLSPEAIRDSGLLDPAAAAQIRNRLRDPSVEPTAKLRLDAIVNHMLCVQLLHDRLVRPNLGELATRQAQELDWAA